MSNAPIRPTTLAGVKRYAKTLKAAGDIPHAKALDAAAAAAGYQNYVHARRTLEGAKARPGHRVYISVPWREQKGSVSGQEILVITLTAALSALVKPHHLKAARHLGVFRIAAADHLACEAVGHGQSNARRMACAAARTLTFMEATGLRPSAGGRRAYPGGRYGNAMPGHDHSSEWFDPTTKAYVFVDEPYERAVEGIAPDRQAWADKHRWLITRPTWKGMYNPDGGCELYLACDPARGFDLDATTTALNALPPALVEAAWNGRTAAMTPPFISPVAHAAAGGKAEPPKPKSAPKATIGYGTFLSHKQRRRPARRMPVDGHAEVGRLLKSVIHHHYGRRSVYKPLDSVRCELDNWVQCEYDSTELSAAVFFDLYYHEDEMPDDGLEGPARIARHAASLARAKVVLGQNYPDCAPLRAMLKSIDRAVTALSAQ